MKLFESFKIITPKIVTIWHLKQDSMNSLPNMKNLCPMEFLDLIKKITKVKQFQNLQNFWNTHNQVMLTFNHSLAINTSLD